MTAATPEPEFDTTATDFNFQPLPPDVARDLIDTSHDTFSDEDGARPNRLTAALVARTLVAAKPPLLRAGSRRFAFDGTRWTPDRADDRAATWIRDACAYYQEEEAPWRGSRRTWAEAVFQQFVQWGQAPQMAVRALYAALPDAGADALWEDAPEHLNTPAGVVTLRDGTLTTADDAAFAGGYTRLAVAPAPPGAVSQLWLDFLASALPDPAVRDWLQKACGYLATGNYTEDINLWLLGETRTGKSTFTGALRGALGSYAYKDDTTALLRTQTRRLRLGDELRGVRLLRMAEMEEKYTVDAARLKDLSGGDEVPGAGAGGGGGGGWMPQFTILVESNHMPALVDHSGATGERMRVVRFDARRRGHQIDPTVRTRLRTSEAPGVLRWMLDGAVRYFREGLYDVPDAIREATAAVLAAQDPEGTFYSQLHASAEPMPYATLYAALATRCTAANKPVPGKNVVAARLASKGFPVVHGAHNARVVYARVGSESAPASAG